MAEPTNDPHAPGPVPAPAGPASDASSRSAIPETRSRRRRRTDRVNWRLAVTGALALAGGLLLAGLARAVVMRLQGLLITMLVSLFLSFAMEPAVQWLARQGVRRGVGTALVFLAAMLLLIGFLAAMAPLVVGQVRNLVDAGPSLLNGLAQQASELPGEAGTAVSEWLRTQAQELPDRIPEFAETVGRGALGLGTTLLGGLLQGLTALLVTFYLVADGPRLRRTLISRVEPSRQREFLAVWELAIGKTGGYVYSRVLTAVASALFHIAVFTIIGIPYSAALGVWVGIVSSLIPVVGTYIAGALPLVIALSADPVDAIWILAAIVVYQQVENYLIAPRITAATMELHPAVAFVAVLVGGSLLGPAGALLALPATAIITALVSAYGERHDVLEHGLTSDTATSGLRGGASST